jgi:hypothetical protein
VTWHVPGTAVHHWKVKVLDEELNPFESLMRLVTVQYVQLGAQLAGVIKLERKLASSYGQPPHCGVPCASSAGSSVPTSKFTRIQIK